MESFVDQIGVLFIAALLISAVAVTWWLLTERHAKLIRQRAEAQRKAAEAAKAEDSALDSDDHK